MTFKLLAALLLTASAPAAIAQETTADVVPVTIETSVGRITVELDKGRAPATTANFLRYVDARRYDGEAFYRAMPMPDGGLIQGGIRSDARKLFPGVKHEPTSETGLRHVAGTISLANAGPGTGRADFFILTSDVPGFDATAEDSGFAAFGKVTEGMDVVKTILASPVSATKGDGPMKGQMLEPVVKIIKVTRAK